ncbi:MAG: hypothetical protein HFF08_08375 [Oscillospiraceae bacterium]|nr:hypothetical protein [Oscillospiraceae bacterium]
MLQKKRFRAARNHKAFFIFFLPCQFLSAVALLPCGISLDNQPVTCYDIGDSIKSKEWFSNGISAYKGFGDRERAD